MVIIVLKKYTAFKENVFFLKLILIFSFKIYSKTLEPDLDPESGSKLKKVKPVQSFKYKKYG